MGGFGDFLGFGEDVDVHIVTREVPKIEVRQVERIVEVPNVQYRDRIVEVPQIIEIVRRVPRVEIREIPIERIIQVPKKIIQEVERPVYRPVPHLVQQAVTREIPVPRTYVQTMEVVKQVPYAQGSVPPPPPPAPVVFAAPAPVIQQVIRVATPPPSPPPSPKVEVRPIVQLPPTIHPAVVTKSKTVVSTQLLPSTATVPAAPPRTVVSAPQEEYVLTKIVGGQVVSSQHVDQGAAAAVTASARFQGAPPTSSMGGFTTQIQRPGYMTPPTPPVGGVEQPQLLTVPQTGIGQGRLNMSTLEPGAPNPFASAAGSMFLPMQPPQTGPPGSNQPRPPGSMPGYPTYGTQLGVPSVGPAQSSQLFGSRTG